MTPTQRKGILAGLVSGALWGFVFVAPKMAPTVPSSLIACGRFLFYGLVSLLALGLAYSRGARMQGLVNRGALKHAALFALAGNSLYYFFLVLGIRYAGVTASSLIIGLLPVTVALAGNGWRLDRTLAPSLSLIVVGITLVNVSLIDKSANIVASGQDPLLGVLFLLLSLALWTWYAVANSRFLKANPRISGSLWSSLTGVFTLVFSPTLVIALAGPAATIEALQSMTSSGSWGPFLLCSAAMGLGSSWVALWFWNIASHALPSVLSGQLIVSETVFALLYGFIYDGKLPTPLEIAAIVLLISGVILAVKALGRRS